MAIPAYYSLLQRGSSGPDVALTHYNPLGYINSYNTYYSINKQSRSFKPPRITYFDMVMKKTRQMIMKILKQMIQRAKKTIINVRIDGITRYDIGMS